MPFTDKKKILDKRRLRRHWHQLRTTKNKRLLNAATRELKQLNNNRNHNIQTFLQGLTPTASTD
jgi:ribosomal protein S21